MTGCDGICVKSSPMTESMFPTVHRSSTAPSQPPKGPPSQRGTVRKAESYDPIRKFERGNFKMESDAAPNYIRKDDDQAAGDLAKFEMPNFEHLKGNQWMDQSLLFNNVATVKSGSHLDEWSSNRDDNEAEDEPTDLRAWGKAIRQEEEERASSGIAPDDVAASFTDPSQDLVPQISNRLNEMLFYSISDATTCWFTQQCLRTGSKKHQSPPCFCQCH